VSAKVVLIVALLAAGTGPAVPPDFAAERERMVSTQIEARGVRDPRVLAAMRRVPRHRFVPEELVAEAHEDRPLPIGSGQTISQPYVVAVMSELLAPARGDKVLEIGTGSGYQAAILAELGARVFSIEIVPALAEQARRNLSANGYGEVVVIQGDGWLGLPQEAPFDRILVTAAPDEVPPALVDQLRVGGRLVLPVGSADQRLRVIEKKATGIETRDVFGVRFVPMIKGPRPTTP
jgi:protein-L-isoaspartate(D-aspartate) O-methyltransferase